MLSLHIVFIILISIVNAKESEQECKRIHKAWHLTTETEKDLYISAIHKLNEQDKLAKFSTTHHFATDSEQSHYTAAFFAWHRYFIWEFENQVRALGPEYECFAVPYWDITHDAGELADSYIFRSGIGGCGDINNDLCVDIENDGAWSRNNYPLKHVCHESEDVEDNDINGCCLKRRSNGYGYDVSGVSSYVHFIKYFKNFGPAHGFRQNTFLKYHGEAHGYIGGTLSDYTQMISRYSPDDPTFWMLHTWLDYVFEVWKNCWGYHQIDSQVLQEYLDAYDPYPVDEQGTPNSELDTVLKYIPMNEVDWWRGLEMNPTPRKLWNAKDWDFQFERGTFIKNGHLTALCEDMNDEFNWDPEVLLENSQSTKKIIELGGSTEIEEYEAKTWKYLHEVMYIELEEMDPYSEGDYVQTWEAKTCNYQRQRLGNEPCYIPSDYEMCSDSDKLRANEITIDELLEKEGVAGNQCLEDVRIKMYGYAKSMGMLYQLCNGEFDALHICNIPLIDFMVEEDDKGYYQKMEEIKNRMKKEGRLNSIGLVSDIIIDGFGGGEGIGDDLDGGGSIPVYQYVGFDVLVYSVIGIIIVGLIFILCVKQCTEKQGDEDGDNNVREQNIARKRGVNGVKLYGSFYQMV